MGEKRGLHDPPRRQFLKSVGAAGVLMAMRPIGRWGQVCAQDLPKPGPADWPRYGCDLHNTRFNAREKTLGRNNVGRLKVKWTFDAGPIQNCPAVIGDTLFFASWDGYEYALDTATGRLKWKFDCGVKAEDNGLHDIRSSPQYVDGRLYFGTGAAKVHCLDAATGKEIWQTLVDDQPLNDPGISCAVNVHKGRVFVGTASGHAQIVSLDAETGKVRWRFYTVPTSESGGGSVWNSPAIDEERDIVYDATGSVKAFMPAGPMLFTESVLAHDANTGELLWYYQARAADTHDLDFSCHPMIFDAVHPRRPGAVRKCVGAGKKEGFYCFDRYTGELCWKAMLTNPSANGGPETNSTGVAYNRVFLVSNAIGPKGGVSVAAALNAFTGEIEWWVPNSAVVRGPVAIANGVFYQGLMDGSLEALDTETGRSLWQFKLPSAARSGVAIANGALYTSHGEYSVSTKLSTNRYSLYAFTVDGK